MLNKNNIKYGDIYKIDLGEQVGSEQSGIKYCVVVQNNTGNIYSPTTIVCPITRAVHKHVMKAKVPTHCHIEPNDKNNMIKPSIILCEQIRVVDKNRILEYYGALNYNEKIKMGKCLRISIPVKEE